MYGCVHVACLTTLYVRYACLLIMVNVPTAVHRTSGICGYVWGMFVHNLTYIHTYRTIRYNTLPGELHPRGVYLMFALYIHTAFHVYIT